MAKKLTQEEKINQMYDANLASTKETLEQDYKNADAEYVRQQEQAQKTTDENLTRTAVEAQKEAVNNAEINNAAGLSSGARAQLRLSSQNQMRSDMTALRTQQQETDAEIERRRALLSHEYASAIRKAQQDNDLARAEALYKEAEKQEELLRQKQEQAEAEEKANALTAAQLLASAGDYSRLGKYYGLSDEEITKLSAAAQTVQQTQGTSQGNLGTTGSDSPNINFGGTADNGGLDTSYIAAMQNELGIDTDGRWGPKSREAAYKMWGTTDPVEAYQKHQKTGANRNALQQAISAHNSEIQNAQYSSMSERSLAKREAYFEWVSLLAEAQEQGKITGKQRSELLSFINTL